MDASEIEFLAEKTPISIVPNFTQEKLYLISGDVGPFAPGIPVEVPLWLGLNLRQRGKCRLVMPDWLDEEKLAEKKEEETQSKVFTEMPSEHYLIIAQLLLAAEPEGIPNPQEVKTLIKDIWDLRISKLRSSVADFILSDGTHAKLDRLTLLEINSIRPILPHSLDQLHRLAKSAHTNELSQTQEL
ncbi:probable DNA replication complex GINS protein PSF2 isoform X2 [Eriocheir sinensis]|nr:probable DNA replication complex GINS protein PSF2 isoform X2 [Eriocheir sinensis]XP_050733750.1 probable DNA replication complex GINS protein PSF2 isoform X2 [Eriocheir sinensis]XP_050733751.1 probable DNA replication complex GINS protein PSF2 isoform X2 [Eriocheir sinensis]XP_050733752.1 probable DNA replication complex GINS protein PSF2 isoform X2 [Eriocheir sinensis]